MSKNFLEKNGEANQITLYAGGDKTFLTKEEALVYDASCNLVDAYIDSNHRRLNVHDINIAKGLAKWILENYDVIEK